MPADPEKIFETIYFTKGNAMITFYTDKEGNNFLGNSPEQREELRENMKRQRETSNAKERLPSNGGNTSGNQNMDTALAQHYANNQQPQNKTKNFNTRSSVNNGRT